MKALEIKGRIVISTWSDLNPNDKRPYGLASIHALAVIIFQVGNVLTPIATSRMGCGFWTHHPDLQREESFCRHLSHRRKYKGRAKIFKHQDWPVPKLSCSRSSGSWKIQNHTCQETSQLTLVLQVSSLHAHGEEVRVWSNVHSDNYY